MKALLKMARTGALVTVIASLLGLATPFMVTASAAAAPAAAPASLGHHCRQKVLRKGDRGKCVRYFQHMFNFWKDDFGECNMNRHRADLVEDGVFGIKTKRAVKYLQLFCGNKITGVVNHQTWRDVPLPGTF
jgi:hypothetical protein